MVIGTPMPAEVATALSGPVLLLLTPVAEALLALTELRERTLAEG